MAEKQDFTNTVKELSQECSFLKEFIELGSKNIQDINVIICSFKEALFDVKPFGFTKIRKEPVEIRKSENNIEKTPPKESEEIKIEEIEKQITPEMALIDDIRHESDVDRDIEYEEVIYETEDTPDVFETMEMFEEETEIFLSGEKTDNPFENTTADENKKAQSETVTQQTEEPNGNNKDSDEVEVIEDEAEKEADEWNETEIPSEDEALNALEKIDEVIEEVESKTEITEAKEEPEETKPDKKTKTKKRKSGKQDKKLPPVKGDFKNKNIDEMIKEIAEEEPENQENDDDIEFL